MGDVLLFSGGVDSTSLAAIGGPLLLFVDYGQLSAPAESRAAHAIASVLGLRLRSIKLDLREVGSGLLHGERESKEAPSPEWWPYRNQFLATAGAAIAHEEGLSRVLLGSVSTDGLRHVDGTRRFYEALDALIALQEGGIHVAAPALELTTAELVQRAALDPSVLALTYSCHRACRPCGDCPGCWKRTELLRELGIAD